MITGENTKLSGIMRLVSGEDALRIAAAVLMSASTVIVAINAQLLKRANLDA